MGLGIFSAPSLIEGGATAVTEPKLKTHYLVCRIVRLGCQYSEICFSRLVRGRQTN
jgi:hypothetical protein